MIIIAQVDSSGTPWVTGGVTVRMIGSLSIPVIEVKNPAPPATTS